jgi:hypothetical protein
MENTYPNAALDELSNHSDARTPFPSITGGSFPNLFCLSDELIFEIVRYLDPTDMIVFGSSCQRYFQLVFSSPKLWLWLDPNQKNALGTPGFQLDLRWMETAPYHMPILAQRLHEQRIRHLVSEIWLPGMVSGALDLVGFLKYFPNLESLSSGTAFLGESLAAAVLRNRELTTHGSRASDNSSAPSIVDDNSGLLVPSDRSELDDPPNPSETPATPSVESKFLFPNLKNVYLDDEPTLNQYLILSSVLPFLTPHPHPLSVSLCLLCRQTTYPYTTTHDSHGCPVMGCTSCIPESECIRCGLSFCSSHLISIASICPRAEVEGVPDRVCHWCHESRIARCDQCGKLDCPHCSEDAELPHPGSPTGERPATVARCRRCHRSRCSSCAQTYFCGRCNVSECSECVDGCVCVTCDTDLFTCIECYIDVNLAREEMYPEVPKLCLQCDYAFCDQCRLSHWCQGFQLHKKLHQSTSRMRTHIHTVRAERLNRDVS